MTNQNLNVYGEKTLTERSQPLNLSHGLLETMRTHLICTKDQVVLGQMYIRVYYVDTRLESEIVTIDSQVFDRHFMAKRSCFLASICFHQKVLTRNNRESSLSVRNIRGSQSYANDSRRQTFIHYPKR